MLINDFISHAIFTRSFATHSRMIIQGVKNQNFSWNHSTFVYTSITETQRENECLVLFLKSNSQFHEHTLLKTERHLLSLEKEKSETSEQSWYDRIPFEQTE